MPLSLPYPGAYPDPLDPQSVQDLANYAKGGTPLAPIPEPAAHMVGQENEAEKAAYSTPPPAPEINQDAANVDNAESSAVGAASGANIFQGLFQAPRVPPVMDEGSNYLPVGGPFGRDMVNEAFNKQPKNLANAVEDGAAAQVDESKVREGFLKSERDRTRDYEASLKEQYMLRHQEMQAKQQELEKKTQFYTNNLADQGAFWHNPQNVISAMAAALMQLTTDDRSFGYKLLNGAIQQDLHHRRALADQHLGYLKSNMAEYDRIAGDRIAGMQLAEAEAKRVAAIELERISAQFQGPKAKANAAAITSKLWQEVRTAYMEFYNRHLYNKPHREDVGVLQSYERGGQAEPGVGYTRFADPKNPRAGQPGVFPGAPGKPVGPGGKGMGGVPGQAAPSAGGTNPFFRELTDQEKKAIDSRYPQGSLIVKTGHEDVVRRAYTAAGVRPGTPPQMMSKGQIDAFNGSVSGQEKEAYEQLKSVSTDLGKSSQVRTGLRVIQTDMELLEGAVNEFRNRGLNITMDDLLGTRTKATLGSDTTAKWKNIYQAWASANPDNKSKWEAQRDKVEAAGTRLNQLMAGTINAYYKEHAGAAVTMTELPRLQEYAGGNLTYERLKTFVNNESKKASGYETEVMGQLSPAAKALWLVKRGVGATPLEGPNVRKYQPGPGTEQARTERR